MTERPTRHAVVIESEQDVNDLLARHVRQLGYTVSTAVSGERGLALARTERPDLVTLAILLPGINGRQVARALRADANTRGCPIVVCTALDPVDLTDVEADVVLPKPFTRSELAAAVETATERRKSYDHGTGGRG